MGYKIQYGQTMIKRHVPDKAPKTKKPAGLKWIVLISALLMGIYLGSAGYLDFLIPGDREVTKAAFHNMVEDVSAGETVGQAVTAFCLEILESARLDG